MNIDIGTQFDLAIKQMEWGEIVDTLKAAVEEVLGLTPAPAFPTELGHNIYPQPVGDGQWSPHHLEIDPPMMDTQPMMHAGPLYCEAGVHSQGQLYQAAVNGHSESSITDYYPADSPYTNNNPLVMGFFEYTGQELLCPLHFVNSDVVYAYTLYPECAAPPMPTPTPKKRQRHDMQQEKEQQYIKKPLNAFMLFMKEQRQNVVREMNIKNNAKVNTILGQKWASLSDKERHMFYEKAEEEKLLHARQNPGWSSSNNYGKKRKRERRKGQTAAEASPLSSDGPFTLDDAAHTQNMEVH